MSFWDEWSGTILGIAGLGTTIIAWNREAISNKVLKNQDKRDSSNNAMTSSEQAVNIMQDVLASVNEARAADKEREDACHKALMEERQERKKTEEELRDMISRLSQSVEMYRSRVIELETKFGQA
jgi:signal transduction histidine kinase